MTKRYRAYDESIDRWRYFKIKVDETGWELQYLHKCIGDKNKTTIDENFAVAYSNLLKIIEDNKFTKLTELQGEYA